jgi:hypothetical protein
MITFLFRNYKLLSALGGIVISFFSGAYVATKIAHVHELKEVINQQQQTISQYKTSLAKAESQVTLTNFTMSVLRYNLKRVTDEEKANANQILQDADLININNTIDTLFLRNVGAIPATNMPPYSANTSGIPQKDARVPAATVAQWIIGLKNNANTCKVYYDQLYSFCAKQRDIINNDR